MINSAGTAGAHTVGTTAMTFASLSDANTGITLSQVVMNEVMTGTIGGGKQDFHHSSSVCYWKTCGIPQRCPSSSWR